MKFVLLLSAFFIINAYADCEDVYRARAYKRVKNNRPISYIQDNMPIFPSDIASNLLTPKQKKLNTFWKGLDIIKDSKKGIINTQLLLEMENQINLSSFSADKIKEIKQTTLSKIIEMNDSKSICKRNKALKFRKLSNLIIKSVELSI